MDVTTREMIPVRRLIAKSICFCFGLVGAIHMHLMPHACADYQSIDLQVESVQIQPSRPQAGDSLTVVASVRNNGTMSVQGFDIGVLIRQNDAIIKSVNKIPVLSTLPSMGSGKSIPLETGHLNPGHYETVVTVDPENLVQETNEENNVVTQQFTVSNRIYG